MGLILKTCSEMVMPIGNNNSNNMVPLDPFNLTNFISDCKDIYGVPPRPHWTTTYYGGHVFSFFHLFNILSIPYVNQNSA